VLFIAEQQPLHTNKTRKAGGGLANERVDFNAEPVFVSTKEVLRGREFMLSEFVL